ncbi:MAG: hypothetical protein QN188_10565, partial [Armatimonadota bacterium]|nr:hypothetical protein [Armatimonadota bacterium]
STYLWSVAAYQSSVLVLARRLAFSSDRWVSSDKVIPDGTVSRPRSRSRSNPWRTASASFFVPWTVFESHFLEPVAGSLPR